MSSRSIVSASSLVLAILLIAAPAWAGKRVVVLDFSGPKADRFHDDIEAAIKKAKNTIVSVDDWNSKAEDMGATKVTSNNVMKVAHKLKVNGVVVGEVEKRGPRYYVHLRLREGATGEYVAEVEIVVRQGKLGDDGLKVVKDELLPAIKDLSTAKGRDDGDDDSGDDDEGDDPQPKSKKKKHGGFDRNADDMDSDSGDDSDPGDDSGDSDDDAPKHKKKDSKKDKKAKKGHHDDDADADDADADASDDSGDSDDDSPKHKKKDSKKKSKKGHHDDDDSGDSGDDSGDAGDGDDDGGDRTAAADDNGDDSGDDGDHHDRGGDVEAGPAAAAIPSDWRTRAFDVGAGVSGTARRLTFTTASGSAVTPQGYKGNVVAGARFDADLFPLAFNRKNHSITRHFGLTVAFDRVLKIQSKLDYTDMTTGMSATAVLATTEQRYQAGLVYRAPVGDKMLIDASLKYDRMKFVIDKAAAPPGATINIPNVDYTFVDPGVAVKYATSPKLLIGAGLGVGFVLNTGEMQQADQYGAATVLGVDLGAGAAYYVTPNIVVRLDGRLTTFGFTFKGTGTASNPNGDNIVDVPKGRDTYVGGALTASYEY